MDKNERKSKKQYMNKMIKITKEIKLFLKEPKGNSGNEK